MLVFTLCIKSITMNGRITVSGVLKMLSSFKSISERAFCVSVRSASGLVPVITLANNTLVQNGILSTKCAAAEKSTIFSRVHISVSFTAFMLKVSSSFSLSLAVLSKTIIASAKIPKLAKNMFGKSIRGSPLNCMLPKSIPASMSSSTSGIFSLLPIQEHITPTNSITAIAVVMISASCIFIIVFKGYLNVYNYCRTPNLFKRLLVSA